MGTHPIFESDFDCLTECFLYSRKRWTGSMPIWQGGGTLTFMASKELNEFFQVILVVCGVIGFLYGYSTESMQNSMIVLGGGLGLSSLLTVLPWGFLRPQEKDLKWHDECDEDDDRLYPSWHKRE